jgi:hypothetical protein
MVPATTLIGTESMVAQRLCAWREAGVDTVRLYQREIPSVLDWTLWPERSS